MAAETLVLANLVVDTTGMVQPVQAAGAAVLGLGNTFAPVGQKAAAATGFFTAMFGRMTSLRVAAIALGRALGLAGLLTGLAFAVVGLVKELIIGTDWFKRATEAVTDWWRELVHGEEAVDRIARKMADISKGAGFTSIFEMITQVQKLEAAFSETFQKRATTMGGGALFHGLTLDLDEISRQINDLLDKLQKAGFGRDELIGLTGGIHRPAPPSPFAKPKPTVFETFGVLSPAEAQKTLDLALRAKIIFTELAKTEPLFNLEDALKKVASALERIGFTKEQIEELGLVFQKVTPQIKPFEEMVKSAAEHFSRAQLAVDAFTMALDSMASALTEALVEGNHGFREAMAEMMKSLAQMAFVYALWNLALGIMASTPWGLAILGPPAPYFKAAAAFGAVGLAAAGAARALGSGGGSSGGAGAGGAAGATQSAPEPNRSVVVTFNGPTFGFNEAGFARYLLDLQRRGERSNG